MYYFTFFCRMSFLGDGLIARRGTSPTRGHKFNWAFYDTSTFFFNFIKMEA